MVDEDIDEYYKFFDYSGPVLTVASSGEIKEILNSIKTLRSLMEELLSNNEKYKEIAKKLAPHNDIFFIGRKVDYALAQEESLNLKEIS